jgi:Predicted membrane protein (DUF2232)
MIANLIAVVAGLAAAMCYIVGLSFSAWGLFLVLLSPLPIFMAGLGGGATAGGIAGAVAVVASLVYSSSDPLLGSVFSMFFVLPAFFLARLAVLSRQDDAGKTDWFPLGGLAQALIVIGLLDVTLTAVVLSLSEAGLAGTVRQNLALIVGMVYADSAPQDYAVIIDQWDSLVFGALVAVVMVSLAATGALAQGLLASQGRNIRPTPQFWRLRLPNWPVVGVIVCVAVGFVAEDLFGTSDAVIFVSYVSTGFALVFVVGFLLQGLAVMHGMTRGQSFQFLILTGVYLVVITFQPFGALTFAAVGLADRWGNFRERFGPGLDPEMED